MIQLVLNTRMTLGNKNTLESSFKMNDPSLSSRDSEIVSFLIFTFNSIIGKIFNIFRRTGLEYFTSLHSSSRATGEDF